MGEFHDLAEIPLNDPGRAWGNLGYWRDATSYSAACEALARLLGDSLELDGDSRVFDAGFGCGDQLLLWLEHYRVRDLYGINLSRSQTEHARRRLGALGQASVASRLLEFDIDSSQAWALPGDSAINCVIALDCAYHFPSLRRFLEKAAALLPPGGKLGLSTFIPGRRGSVAERTILASMLRASRVPRENLLDARALCAAAESAGFGAAQTIDIGEHVLPGFNAFQRRFTGDLPARSRLKFALAGSFLDWAYRRHLLGYVVLRATRS